MQKSEFDELTKELSLRKEFLSVLEEGKNGLSVSYRMGRYNTNDLHNLDEVELRFIKQHSENVIKKLNEKLSQVIHG